MSMLKYFLHRGLVSLLLIWGVMSVTFVLMQLAPGDPASFYIRPEIDAGVVENIRHQMGLDLPVWQQYLRWSREFLTGHFGASFAQHRPVADIFREAIPNTLLLTGSALLLQALLGIPLGVLTAIKRHTALDHGVSTFLLLIYSLPGFWLGLMGIYLFSFKLGWLPASHMHTILEERGGWERLLDHLRHLIMPAFVLAVPFMATTARFVRGSFVDVLEQDFIRAARARGLSAGKIYFKYALKAALLPMVSLWGMYLPFLIGGSVVIESVFAWPGMGRITVEALFAQDYPVILATTFLAAAAVILGNLLADLLYAAVDPRIKRAGGVS